MAGIKRTEPGSKAPESYANSCASELTRAACRPASVPHLFEIIEIPNFRTEDVNNNDACIDQHPIALGSAFDTGLNAGFMQILDDPVGHRTDMALRPAGGHGH